MYWLCMFSRIKSRLFSLESRLLPDPVWLSSFISWQCPAQTTPQDAPLTSKHLTNSVFCFLCPSYLRTLFQPEILTTPMLFSSFKNHTWSFRRPSLILHLSLPKIPVLNLLSYNWLLYLKYLLNSPTFHLHYHHLVLDCHRCNLFKWSLCAYFW